MRLLVLFVLALGLVSAGMAEPDPTDTEFEDTCSQILCLLTIRAQYPEHRPLGPDGLLHRDDGRTFPLTRLDGARAVETEGVAKITAANIEFLFTHEYRKGFFGAKGIFSRGWSLSTDAKDVAFFWRTGVREKGWSFITAMRWLPSSAWKRKKQRELS